MSFPTDIVFLPAVAVAQVYVENRYFFKDIDKRSVQIRMSVLVTALSLAISVCLYLDIFSFQLLAPGMTGNDFMWNWPIFQIFGERIVSLKFIPTYTNSSLNSIAVFFFVFIYPFAYWIGIQIGYILFGRSEKQKVGIDLVFPRKEGDKDIFN